MDNIEAIAALAALAQTTRLDTFRLLVTREPGGVPAGELARLRELTLFLLKDCCGGRPDVCAPLVADLAPCCSFKERAHD